MSVAQFKRLLMVLAFPLLGLGLWLAESEDFIPTDYRTACVEMNGDVRCYSSLVTPAEVTKRWLANPGVSLSHRATMTGVMARIVEIDETVAFSNSRYDADAQPASAVRQIIIGARIDPDSQTRVPCEIKQSGGADNIWSFWCYHANLYSYDKRRYFRFADENVNGIYAKAVHLAEEQAHDYEIRARLAYGATVCVPLLGFLLLSGLFVSLIKIVTFVRYGRAARSAQKA